MALTNPKNIFKKIFKFFIWAIGIPLVILFLFLISLQFPYEQKYLSRKVARFIAEKIKSKVLLGKIGVTFPKSIEINDVYVEDLHSDTLFYCHSVKLGLDLWALLSKKVIVNSVHVEKLTAHVYREFPDTSFNFSFILNAFLSPESDTIPLSTIPTIPSSLNKPIRPSTPENAADTSLQFLIKEFRCENIYLTFHDTLAGLNADLHLGLLKTTLDEIDLMKNEIHIKSLAFENTSTAITQSIPLIHEEKKPSGSSDMNLILDDLVLKNLEFSFDNLNENPKQNIMDFNHLKITNFNMNAGDIFINPKKINLSLNQLNFTEKSGFVLKNFATELSYDTTHIELKNLDLQTNHCRIGDYLAFTYRTLPNGIDSARKVQMNIDINHTYFGLSDIKFFAPEILNNPLFVHPENMVINFKSKVTGTLDDMNLEDLEITTNQQTVIKVAGAFKNVLVPEEMYLNLRLCEISTTSDELKQLLSHQVFPAWINIPSVININTHFNGYQKNFDAGFTLKTSFGNVGAYVKMNPSAGNTVQNHTIKVNIQNFNLGKLLNQTEKLGLLDLGLNVNGYGLDMNNLKSAIKLNLNKAFINGYEYKNLLVDGMIIKKSFKGKVTMNDNNFAFDFNGLIDADEKHPEFQFIFDLNNLDLKSLKLSEDELKVNGNIFCNFQGTSETNFIGSASLKNFVITKKDSKYNLDPIVIISDYFNGITDIKVQSEIINAFYKGDFNLSELPDFITGQVNNLLADSPDQSKPKKTEKYFNFGLDLNIPHYLTENLIPELAKLSPVHISGGYDKNIKKMQCNLSIDQISYTDLNIESLSLEAGIKDNKLNYSLNLGEFSNPDIRLMNIYFGGEVKDNSLIFSLNEMKENKSGLLALSLKDKKEWMTARTDGKIVFNNKTQTNVINSDISIHDIHFENNPFGYIHLNASNLNNPNIYHIKININGNENEANITGDYDMSDTLGTLNYAFDFQKFNLHSIFPFVTGQLSNITGYLSGKWKVTGTQKDPRLSGFVTFEKCGFKSDLINSYLKIDNSQIIFDARKILFKSFTLFDSLNNQAIADGYADFNNLDSIRFDVILKTRNFRALNTSKKDNPLYYGKIFLDSDIHLTGNPEHPVADVKVKLNKGSSLTYIKPESAVEKTESNGIVEFVDYKKPITLSNNEKKEFSRKASANASIDINAILTIDEDVQFVVLLDPVTGDSLFIKGEGSLNYVLDPAGNTSLSGKYGITDGICHLALNNFIKKDFQIENGSFLSWSGDILDANVDIKAIYSLRISPLELMQEPSVEMDEAEKIKYQRLTTFWVYLKMAGIISSPEISFDILISPKESENDNNAINEKLIKLREDESELNQQAFALLVTNKFISENPSEKEGDPEASARASASKLLTNQLNKLSKKYVKGVDLDFGVNSYEDKSSGGEEGRTELKAGITKQLFKNRLSVHVGGQVNVEEDDSDENSSGSDETDNSDSPNDESSDSDTDTGDSGDDESSDDVARDIRIDYKITQDGAYKLKLFRKIVYENPIEGELTKGGIGFSLKKDYNTMADFFSAKKAKTKNK